MARVMESVPGPIVRLGAVPASIGFGQTAFLSLIPVIAVQTGLGLGAIGFAAAAGTVAFLIGAPFWGRRAEQIGRRRLLLILAGIVFASHLLLLGSLTAGAQNVVLVVVLLAGSRFIYGAAASGLIPTAQAWAMDIAEPDRKTGALGLLSAIGGTGRVMGAAAASLGLLTPLAPFVALAASPLLIVFAPKESEPHRPKRPPGATGLSAFDRRVMPALVIGFLLTLGATQSQIALGPYIAARLGYGPERAAAEVGVLLGFAAITMILVQALIATRSPRRPEGLLIVGAIGVVCGSLLFATVGNTVGFAFAAIVMAIGFALAGPGAAAWLGHQVPARDRAAAFGWLASAQVCGQAAGALAGGAAFEFWPPLPFLGSAFVGVAIGGLALVLMRRARPVRSEPMRALPSPFSDQS